MALVMTDQGIFRVPDAPAELTGDADAGIGGPPPLPPGPPTPTPMPSHFPHGEEVWANATPQQQQAWIRANPPKVAAGSNVTKAQVRLNVRRGVWSADQGVRYLMDTYKLDEDEAIAELTTTATGGGGGVRGRAPELVEGTMLDNEAKRARMQREIEDAAFRRDVDARNFGVSEEQRAIDNEIRQAQFEEAKARDRRDFAAAEKWRERADYWTGVREERAGARQRSDIALRESADRRSNLDINLRRNDQFGEVIDAEGTGLAAGTLTASERQRRFQNTRGIAQDAIGLGEREAERRQRAAAFENQLVQQQYAREDAGLDREEQRRQFEVQMQTAAANRQRPARFTPGMVASRQGY